MENRMATTDERRQNFRVDVPVCLAIDTSLAMSYQSVDPATEALERWQWDDLGVSPDVIRNLLIQTDVVTQEPLLLQMLARIDWMLTSVLKTLSKDQKLRGELPEFMTVNLSSSGIRFTARERFPIGDLIKLRLVFKPFVPVQALGKILRVQPVKRGEEERFETAVEFTDISSDDHEAIIRHVIRTQAEIQRMRKAQRPGSLL